MSNLALVAFVIKALIEGWGYVLGANGELYTKALAESWAKTRNKPSSWSGTKVAYFVTACARWFGRRVADCSGLIIAAFRSVNSKYQDQKADTLYDRCTQKGVIKTIPEIPGLCVWKKGHIGIYIGNGYAIESRGYKYGVVKTTVKSRPWTHWGKLRDIVYDNMPVKGDEDMVIKKGMKDPTKDGAVAAWQTILKTLGFNIGTFSDKNGKPTGIDGDFGTTTETRTKDMQKQYGLTVTGIVDEKTLFAGVAAAIAKGGNNAELTAALARIANGIKALTA